MVAFQKELCTEHTLSTKNTKECPFEKSQNVSESMGMPADAYAISVVKDRTIAGLSPQQKSREMPCCCSCSMLACIFGVRTMSTASTHSFPNFVVHFSDDLRWHGLKQGPSRIWKTIDQFHVLQQSRFITFLIKHVENSMILLFIFQKFLWINCLTLQDIAQIFLALKFPNL